MNPERLDLVATAARQQISRVNAFLEMSNVIHAEQIRRNRATERVASATKLAYADPAGIDDGEDFMLADATASMRLAADIANATDMTQRDGVWVAEPVVTPDEEPDFLANVKAAFNREDSASFHEPDMDHAEPHDTPGQRVIPAPGTAKVEEERAEWDRTNDGDRFE